MQECSELRTGSIKSRRVYIGPGHLHVVFATRRLWKVSSNSSLYHLYELHRIGKFVKMEESRLEVTGGLEGRNVELLLNSKVSVWGWWKHSGNRRWWWLHFEGTYHHWIIHWKMVKIVHFIYVFLNSNWKSNLAFNLGLKKNNNFLRGRSSGAQGP